MPSATARANTPNRPKAPTERVATKKARRRIDASTSLNPFHVANKSTRLLAAVLIRGLDLRPQVFQRHFQLAILEIELRLRAIGSVDDFSLSLIIPQRIEFFRRQFQIVAGIRLHTPFVLRPAFGTGLIQVLIVGPPECCRRQFQNSAGAGETVNSLHASFAVAPRTHDDRPSVVLQTCRYDFARAGAVAVDQADHWELGKRAVGFSDVRRFAAVSRSYSYDQTIFDEKIGDLHGAVE